MEKYTGIANQSKHVKHLKNKDYVRAVHLVDHTPSIRIQCLKKKTKNKTVMRVTTNDAALHGHDIQTPLEACQRRTHAQDFDRRLHRYTSSRTRKEDRSGLSASSLYNPPAYRVTHIAKNMKTSTKTTSSEPSPVVWASLACLPPARKNR